jgi:hypothetical protein
VSTATPLRWGHDVALVLRAVLPRPWLWIAAFGAMTRLARRGWWHRPPFLPLPGADYWQFRLITALGGTGVEESLSTADVVAYLQWCQRSRPTRG